MDVIVKLNSQAAGRDKLARIVQYSSKLVWYELQKTKVDRYTIDQLKTLEATCSSFRKLLRFGRCIDSMYSALSTIHYPDLVIRITLTLSKISNSLFLFADHILWLARTGFLRNVDSNKWNEVSNKYWFLTIVMNLVRDIYEIQKILRCEKRFIFSNGNFNQNTSSVEKIMVVLERSFSVIKGRKDILTDTIKNCCDVWIPLNALGRVNLQPGTIGLLGAVSSAAALLALLQPAAKLSPA